ncbi:MAG: YbaB/EbfC family nucleoid-associated protein [Clostridia bacterium]|nr:YbaB/EbfC family nucleoid-associated protein [Clostridia bacterium]
MSKGRKPQMPGNMGNMMKQVQQMQKNMEKMQSEIEEQEFEATAGGGAIRVVANGKKEITAIELKEEIVDPDDIEMLQDLIMVAVNDAIKAAEKAMSEAMGSMTSGLKMPGLF